jgi:hypothetical protein
MELKTPLPLLLLPRVTPHPFFSRAGCPDGGHFPLLREAEYALYAIHWQLRLTIGHVPSRVLDLCQLWRKRKSWVSGWASRTVALLP